MSIRQLSSPYIDFYEVLLLCKISNPRLLARVVAVGIHMNLESIVF